MKAILRIFTSVLFAVVVGGAISFGLDIDPKIPMGGLMIASLIPGQTGVMVMAIQKEIWADHIVGNLFKNNEFLNYAFNADQYVLQGKVVHIPQAGAAPGVEKNRSSLPATVNKRTDVDITYALDEFTSDPVLIPNADNMELSYDKRESVLAETQAGIRQLVADWVLYNWSTTISAQIVRTTGTSGVTAHAPSATGNRKEVLVADIKNMAKVMDKNNVPMEDRYLLLDADMYDQLTDNLGVTQYRDFSKAYDEKKGIVGELYGFKVMKRSSVLYYTAALAVRTPGHAGAATDQAAALAWQKNAVERALGTVDFFEKLGDPLYFGDVYSALVRMGGRKRRNDNKGVVALIQAAAS